MNQAIVQAGGIAVLPEDWADIAAVAGAIDQETCQLNGEFDNNPIAQALAGEMVSKAMGFQAPDPWAIPDGLSASAAQAACAESVSTPWGEKLTLQYDTRWCPGFDEADPNTMNRYYALAYGSTTLYPLEDWPQWEQVADTVFPFPTCSVHLVHDCYRRLDSDTKPKAVETISVSRGEIICIFNVCDLCAVALQGRNGAAIPFDHDRYSGPFPWQASSCVSSEKNWESPQEDLYTDD